MRRRPLADGWPVSVPTPADARRCLEDQQIKLY
jgi:hypothetical protein